VVPVAFGIAAPHAALVVAIFGATHSNSGGVGGAGGVGVVGAGGVVSVGAGVTGSPDEEPVPCGAGAEELLLHAGARTARARQATTTSDERTADRCMRVNVTE